MASSADNLVRDGITAYKAGNKEQARNLFLQAVEADEQSEQAWLWLSAVIDSPEDKQTCLENVLTINPANEQARRGLDLLKQGGDSARSISSSSGEDDDVFANASFTPTASVSPFADAADDDELPDISWGDNLATSSASARNSVPEPTADDYNQWIDGLNIGESHAGEAFGPVTNEAAPGSSPFIGGEDIFGDESDSPFVLDDDVFGFNDEAFSARSDLTQEDNFDIDLDLDDEPATFAQMGPISTEAKPASRLSGLLVDDDDDPLLADIVADDDDDDFFSSELLDDEDYDEQDLQAEPEELFRFIPQNIKATRLPGTNERYPALLLVSLIVLFLGNIGAIVFIFTTLSSG